MPPGPDTVLHTGARRGNSHAATYPTLMSVQFSLLFYKFSNNFAAHNDETSLVYYSSFAAKNVTNLLICIGEIDFINLTTLNRSNGSATVLRYRISQ